MLLDNKTENTEKVYEKIQELNAAGSFFSVTGYFSAGGLNFLNNTLNSAISEFQFILGELTSLENERNRPLDLLNETIGFDQALNLTPQIKKIIEFLRQDKVKIKTLKPNFCHAKTYIFKSRENKAEKNYFITGSSNLTEAGIGLKKSSNIELNVYETGTNSNYNEMLLWFQKLWSDREARETIDIEGKTHSFKEYIIDELKKIIKEYTPEELYYKVLYELFKDEVILHQDDPDFMRDFGRLENTSVYKSLFEFQKKGVLNLIRMLQDYDGAILADAVGLGKTWTSLAVMKFFQMKGFDIILLCPKKLQHNWQQYKARMGSKFEEDNLNYTIRFHTDLQDRRLEAYDDHYTIEGYFQSDRPKLIVIDESHNLRNDKSARYQLLLNELI
ncbi:MAG TPA: phospholipase D-like domain-containing protein, partial [Leptospiraceae bacterium]|nr:phospholipase D-like domain-containing protein [Leptospiraceae bacterium]